METQFDHKVYDLPLIEANQQDFINQCNGLHTLFQQIYDTSDSTWTHRRYNIFTLSSTSELFYYLWKNINFCIRNYIGDERPLWMTGWLNYHNNQEILDWHNHVNSVAHGYVSIDPKNTITEFENYQIINKPGRLYIGPSQLRHRVTALEPFDGHRITIAFDVDDRPNIVKAEERIFADIPVY